MNKENEMNESVYAELKRLKAKASAATVVAIAAFALVFIIGILMKNTTLVPIAFVVLIICAILAGRWNKAYSAYYKENVVRNLALDDCDFLENVTFDPQRGISREEVEELRVIPHDIYRSNDLITATYKGVPFRQSDVYMAVRTTDSKGNTHESTAFRGRWLVFDFNKDFNWNLQVFSKKFTSVRRRGGALSFREKRTVKVEFENEAFNREFRVYAEDEHEAFYILTPHMMEALLELHNGLESPLLLFFTGGKLHVAVYNNEDAFEGKLFGELNLEEEKARIFNDLRLITDFVDAFALERDIYRH